MQKQTIALTFIAAEMDAINILPIFTWSSMSNPMHLLLINLFNAIFM